MTRSCCLAFLLIPFCTTACDREDPTADDDDTSEVPTCDPGYILATDLPAEFLEDYPDGCVPEACGAGRWGDLEVGGDTVFVDGYAADDGDGSEGAPITSIQAGLDAAGDAGGGTVAVASGIYFENLLLTDDHDGVHLAGRCRELVVVDGSEGEEDAAGIWADGGWGTDEWTISGLTVTGAPYGGILLTDGHLFVASARLFRNNLVGAAAAYNASMMILDDVEVRDTQPLPNGTLGRGFDVEQGARLEAFSCMVEGNADVGIIAFGEGTTVFLQEVEVRDTQPLQDGTSGWGIWVQGGARLEASSCVVEGNVNAGIVALNWGTEVFLQGVEVRDTQPRPDGTHGRGIDIEDSARLEASSCVVEGNAEVGILVLEEGTEVFLQGVEVRDTQPFLSGIFGRGINVRDGARLEASSCVVEGNAEIGIAAGHEGTEVVLQDVEVRGTQPSLDGTLGRGIYLQDGASLEASSCVVEGNAEVGILADGEGSEIVLQGVDVLDTRRTLPTTVATGLCSQNGASILATDLFLSGPEGPGLMVMNEGYLECSDCEFLDNTFAGALVWSGGTLDLSSTTISGTSPDANEGGGIGIYATDRWASPSLIIDSVIIEDQPYAALWLDGDGSYDIRNSDLSGGYGLEREYPNGITTVLHGDGVVATGGVTAWDGSTGLLLDNNVIQDAYRAGVILDGSSAELTNTTFSNNPTDLIWQHCTGIEEPDGIADVPIVDYCPAYNHGVAPLEFNLYLEEADPLDNKAASPSFSDDSPAHLLSRMPTITPISDIPDPVLEQLAGIPQIHDPPRPERP